MEYTVIFPNGKIQCFFIRAVAEMYATTYNGILINETECLEETVNIL